MRPDRLLAAYLSPLALAIVVLVVCSFADKSAEAQSSQPFPPAQSQRPDQTKPLEDRSAQSAPPAQQPTAAEMSKKETVASAFLRGIGFQEYQVRSSAETMPEEKYGYRPAEGKSKTRSHNSVPPKSALSPNRSTTWRAQTSGSLPNSTARSRPRPATKAAPAPRKPRKNC